MTVVIDASAVLASLIEPGRRGAEASATVATSELIAPHLLDIEVAHSLRRHDRVNGDAAGEALEEFSSMTIRRFDHRSLLPRIWALRHNLSAYDAAYVSLAEITGSPLLTLDRKLANAPGHRAEVIVL
ncbi:MAG: type II toxin-antitoxin system VapC family toxin [Actinomycetota bacterium]|nr:type II toxin-antitoxin system VapC family toxin [Actinomycetota bacterium]